MCYANLPGTSCLLPRQLVDTNLSCAKLPEAIAKFENGHWEGGIIHLPNQTGFIDILATTFDEQKEEERIPPLLPSRRGDQLPKIMGETHDSRATVAVDIVR